MSYRPKRLPNGFGHISKLSGNRSRPYMVRTSNREVIGYAATYEEAYLLLCEYNKMPWNIELKKATFEDIWKIFCETDLDRYSKSTQSSLKSDYKKLAPIENKEYASFKTYHFVRFLNSLDCTENTRNRVIGLLKHFDDVAYQLDIIDKKYAYELKGKSREKKRERVPFTEEEIEKLWDHVDEEFVDYILIYIYTGLRRDELVNLKISDIDLVEWAIKCGSKTEAGKNRLIPVHERIRPLILDIIEKAEDDSFIPWKRVYVGKEFKKVTKRILGIEHIPHEARHTMRTRLDNVGANKVAIDRILGHKSGDTGMDIYTHKTIEQLHEAVALLK